MNQPRIIFWSSIILLIASIVLKIFVLSTAIPGFDEMGISYIAEEITHGKSLYTDYFDHKPPLMHYSLAIFFTFFSLTPIAIFSISFLFDLILLVSIFFVGRKLYGSHYGLLAAALYSVFNSNLSLNTEIILATLGILAWSIYHDYRKNSKTHSLFLCGTLIGISLWFKQSGLMFYIPLVLHSIFLGVRNKNARQSIKEFTLITLGVLLVSIPLLSLMLYSVGSYFIYSIISFNFQFSASTPQLFQIGKALLISLQLFGVLGAVIIAGVHSRNKDKSDSSIYWMIVAIWLFIITSKEVFFQHFFQLIPFIIIASIGVVKKSSSKIQFALCLILIISSAIFLAHGLEQVTRTHLSGEFDKQREVSAYINQTIPKDASIFSDSPTYAILSNRAINNKLIHIAPSFASVFDYSFMCSEDYLVLTHRQKFLKKDVQDCIKNNFTIEKEFKDIGESYVSVYKRN